MNNNNNNIFAAFAAEAEIDEQEVLSEEEEVNQAEPMEVDEPIRRPPRFMGDRVMVEAFIAHCQTNFASFPNRFPNQARKVQYLLNNMGGQAYQWASKLLTRYPEMQQNPEEFIKRIRNTFGDPDLEYHYQRQFRRLRQHGLGNVLDYVNEFRRLAVFIETDEALLVDNFYQGLDSRLQERIDNIFPPPETLDDLARLAVRLDRHMYQQLNRNQKRIKPHRTIPITLNPPRNNNHVQERSNNNNNNRNTERCSYCHRLGHTEDTCFRRQNDIRRQQNNSTNVSAISQVKNTQDICSVLSFCLSTEMSTIYVPLLVDTGAYSCFLDKKHADMFKINHSLGCEIKTVNGINGTSRVYGKTDPIIITYGEFTSQITFYVIDLNNYAGIIGVNWLQDNKASLNFSEEKLMLEFPKLDPEPEAEQPLEINLIRDITAQDPLASDEDTTDTIEIPKELLSIKEVFDEKLPDILPPHRPYDCTIDLKPNSAPFYGPLYSLTVQEQETLKEYIDENLKKGFIKPSKSPYGAPVLFVPKKDGSLRLCVDYRKLNQDTIRNSYPLPLIKDLLDRVQGCSFFTKLDLPGAYNLVRIREGDQPKTAFRTRFGHFEYEVMPFGLTNAPATFQYFLNDILSSVLDKYAFSYIDDILIFSKSYDEHIHHVQEILKILLKNGLYCKLKKCEFFKSSVEFLGYQISDHGLSMCKDKVQAILDWPQPKSVKEVQQFLGLANFYRRFILDFAKIVHPLTKLTRKGEIFEWVEVHEKSFSTLKVAFTTAPVLVIPDQGRPFIVETDASNFAVGAVLSQYDNNNRLHPCAFMSKGLKDAEVRYDIYDKELLAIITALKEWRHYLQGTKEPFKIFCDHRNLKFPRKPEVLSDRQIRWFEFLSKFNYEIVYRNGSQNKKADILSRRPDFFVGLITSTIENNSFFDEIKQQYQNDSDIQKIFKIIKENGN